MKKWFCTIILITTILFSLFGQNNTILYINDMFNQFIQENELPIIIGEEITISGDISLTDRTKFLVFMMNLLNEYESKIFYKLSKEGPVNIEEIVENFIELNRIFDLFRGHIWYNNYEISLVFNFRNVDNEIILDYLKYFGYNFEEYNMLIILDNNTAYDKLIQLIDFLYQINDKTKNYLINYFLHDWESEELFQFKEIKLIDGRIETLNINRCNNHLNTMNSLAEVSFTMIFEILYLLRSKSNYEGYTDMMITLIENKNERNRIINRIRRPWDNDNW